MVYHHVASLLSQLLFQLASTGLSPWMIYSIWSFTHPFARWSRNLWLAWCSMTSDHPVVTPRLYIRGWRPLGKSFMGSQEAGEGWAKGRIPHSLSLDYKHSCGGANGNPTMQQRRCQTLTWKEGWAKSAWGPPCVISGEHAEFTSTSASSN